MNLVDKEIQTFESSKSFVEHLIDFVNTLLSIVLTFEEVTHLINRALKCLPAEQVDALKQLLPKSSINNPINMKKSFEQVMVGNPTTLIAQITENIIEMIITQRGISAIIALATPDAIYSKRSVFFWIYILIIL